MYTIQRCHFGYLMSFGGKIDSTEMRYWFRESKSVLAAAPRTFGIVVDMRDLSPLSIEAREVWEEGKRLFRTKGMLRSAVVVAKDCLASELRRIARSSGTSDWEKFIDASDLPNWQEVAVSWVCHETDPDLALGVPFGRRGLI